MLNIMNKFSIFVLLQVPDCSLKKQFDFLDQIYPKNIFPIYNKKVTTKWTPGKFNKRRKEINKIESQNDNDQTKRLIYSFHRYGDKSILKSDWTRGTPGHILIFDANFPCGLSPFKKTKILISSFPVILLIKEFYNLSYNWPHRIKISSLRCYLPLMTNFMQKKITISVDSFQRN